MSQKVVIEPDFSHQDEIADSVWDSAQSVVSEVQVGQVLLLLEVGGTQHFEVLQSQRQLVANQTREFTESPLLVISAFLVDIAVSLTLVFLLLDALLA